MKDKQAREVQKLTRRIVFHDKRSRYHGDKIAEAVNRIEELSDQKMDMAPSAAFDIAMKQYVATVEALITERINRHIKGECNCDDGN